MSRIRTLKPEILEDSVTASLPDDAFRAFVALILLSDDHGNVRADPRWVEALVFWAAEGTEPGSGKRVLERLARDGLIRLYEVNGQRYAHINGWDRHQRVDKPGKPRVPQPSEGVPLNSREPREDHATDPDLRPPTPTSDHDPEGDHDPRVRASESPPVDDGTMTQIVIGLYREICEPRGMPRVKRGDPPKLSPRIAAVSFRARHAMRLTDRTEPLAQPVVWWRDALTAAAESNWIRSKGFGLGWLVKASDTGESFAERAYAGRYANNAPRDGPSKPTAQEQAEGARQVAQFFGDDEPQHARVVSVEEA